MFGLESNLYTAHSELYLMVTPSLAITLGFATGLTSLFGFAFLTNTAVYVVYPVACFLGLVTFSLIRTGYEKL